ncbi:MAG: hypothetical protein K8R25_07770 [Methanosarcinales archaeon]|nr:hypothetical protein [Methanosarcinales archaeon]
MQPLICVNPCLLIDGSLNREEIINDKNLAAKELWELALKHALELDTCTIEAIKDGYTNSE